MNCPTCKKKRTRFEALDFLPFCSERCKQADLGRWLEGEYRVSRPLRMEDEASMEDFPVEEDSGEEGCRDE